jgi:probable F420-dependent oxidoreductase
MDFGIMFANTGPFADPAGAAELARHAEAAGFESLWTVEHVIYPDDYESAYPYAKDGKMAAAPSTPLPDPLIWLSWVAARSERIKLATGILILPERNPVVLAKEVATLDHLSGGRVELGIGVGWLKEEFDALGVPWERRGKRTDEYIEAMRALWASDHARYDGEFVSFEGASSNPKPVGGTVPIVIGGHSKAAARRAGRYGDGFFPGKGRPHELRELADIIHQTAADAGRDPSAIRITAATPGLFGEDPVGAAEEMAAVGVSRLMVGSFLLHQPSVAEAAAELGERIVAPCAGIEAAAV